MSVPSLQFIDMCLLNMVMVFGQSPLRNSDANCTGAIFCNTSARKSLEFSHFLWRIFVIWGCAVVSSIIVYSQTSCALPVST